MKEIKYVIVIISLLIFNGCGKVDLSMEKIDIRGSIISIGVSATIENKVESLLVEGNIEADTGYDKARIKITKDTVILMDDAKVEATTEYLNKDIIVEVQFIGGVAESYPVQATADIIRITGKSVNSKNEETQQSGEIDSTNENYAESMVRDYRLVVETFYEEDSALNTDIKTNIL